MTVDEKKTRSPMSGGKRSEEMEQSNNDVADDLTYVTVHCVDETKEASDYGDTNDFTFSSDYTDSITSTNSEKPLLKESPAMSQKSAKFEAKLAPVMDDIHEEQSQDCHSIVSGLLEKPAFMKAISCESLRSSVINQACKSALMLSAADKGISSFGSLPKIHIKELVERESFLKKARKNLILMKDVILLSFGTMIAYSAFLSIRNLQSSLNTTGGLGLFSLALGYSMYMPGSILAPFIVKILRPKRSIICALSCQGIYIVANFYPSVYTLLPACLLIGFGNAVFWVSVSSYLIFSANACATKTKKVMEFVLTRFYGVFFLIYQLNNVPGNIISSVILTLGVPSLSYNGSGYVYSNSTSFSGDVIPSNNGSTAAVSFDSPSIANSSSLSSFGFDAGASGGASCGSSYEYATSSTTVVGENVRYILVGGLTAIDLTGIAIIMLFVKPVKTFKARLRLALLKQEARGTLSMFLDRRYLLISPLLMYSGWQMAFMNGDMIKAFITCPLGIQMVGYLAMGFGLTTSLSSYFSGILTKRIGRRVQVLAGILN